MAGLKSNIGINLPPSGSVTSSPLIRSIHWPAAWWPSALKPSADLDCFPDKNEQAQRRDAGMIKASLSFRQALRNATKLWILDPYFYLDGVIPLEESLKGAQQLVQLRINSGALQEKWDKETYEAIFREILMKNNTGSIPEVEWRTDLSSGIIDIHDRFAIIDEELWHFGATVGGGHPSINAFSRGWDARKTGAINFFEELWDKK